jgi:hypothetical protein
MTTQKGTCAMTDNIISFPSPEDFGAAIDDATMYRMEKGASSQARGQERRCALLAIARDRATLMNLACTEPAAFKEFASAVKSFKVFATAQLEVAEAAVARVEFVGENVSLQKKNLSRAKIRKASIKDFSRKKAREDGDAS